VRPGKRVARAGDVAARRLHFDRHRDGVAVVFDQKSTGSRLAGRVQRLPELAFARVPFAERA
jgi:hypothetical protein